ncbi:uncharacterized protein LOC118417905 [Branchiostoma floridae]|uniref:Uncharacterized protein LOC118417905 n=1 Tax=Branchiostoma floridae TaxID=7739 RepID=A0A9J7LCA9_BRAFL|nr:uncharacterized protein LOC118417905 [Branchiostoma floridae]XP_035679555.1 uncharacterized protein LOC118417905 [Branchiostoma floridae]
MVRNTYGKTTWGAAFLDALGNLDTNKRLGRGKSYANTGKVLNVSIDGAKVSAAVQGTSPRPYGVKVQFELLNHAHLQRVYDVINENPLLYGQIINGDLPDELLSTLEEADIDLLPAHWYDMRARCSCPDDANPCKHMAAVYYLITSEIDKNPFTLFNLRGVDLMGYFNIKPSDTDPGYPLPLSRPLRPSSAEIEVNENHILPCPLVKIPPMSDFILSCLRSNPPFSLELDYKSVMEEFYSYAAKQGTKVLDDLMNAGKAGSAHWLSTLDHDDVQNVMSAARFRLILDAKFDSAKLHIHNPVWDKKTAVDMEGSGSTQWVTISSVFKNQMPYTAEVIPLWRDGQEEEQTWLKVDLQTAMQMFLWLSSDFGSPSYRFFFYSCRVAMMLMRNQVLIPDVLPLSRRQQNKIADFKIVWRPVHTAELVAEQLDNLNKIYPEDDPCVEVDEMPLGGCSASLHVLSVLLTKFVKDLHFMHKKSKNNPPPESLAFFSGKVYTIMSIAQQSVPRAINKYFGVFDLIKTELEVAVHISPLKTKGKKIKTEELPPPDHYSMELWVKMRDNELAQHKPIRRFLMSNSWAKAQAMKFLATLHTYLPHVGRLLKEDSIALTAVQLEDFILNTVDVFNNLGVKVILPKELRKILKPKAVVYAELEGSTRNQQSFFSIDDLLTYNWKIAIGNEYIAVHEFQQLLQSGEGLVRFRDKYISVKPEEMSSILNKVKQEPPQLSPLDLLKESLLEDSMFHLSASLSSMVESVKKVDEHPVPHNLVATLRPYQVSGYRWLVSNVQHGFGVILADDMGLGKTIQSIAAMLHLKNRGDLTHPVLLVVPTSVMSNWEREIQRFAPSLTVSRYYGAGRTLPSTQCHGNSDDLALQEYENQTDTPNGAGKRPSAGEGPKKKRARVSWDVPHTDIIITTYHIVRIDVDSLAKIQYSMVLIDEAQYIKNCKSQTAKAMKRMKAKMHVALSGTPVENNLSELWSVFDFTFPKYLGTNKDFTHAYAKPIELHRDADRVEALRAITRPFLLRRLKTDKSIIKDLPDKITTPKYNSLTAEQAALYESVVQNMVKKLAEAKEKKERTGVIFQTMTFLKQICNHPANFTKNSNRDIQASGKMKVLIDLLQPILQQGEKVLIFSQYVQMIKLMAQMVEAHFKVKPLIFEGSLSQQKRDEATTAFQTQPHRQIMIVSLQAGGVGLNLTAANHVIHYDLWFNPAKENQATDRAFRIGQTKTVFVYRFISENTFEEKIDAMLEKKKDLSDLSVQAGETWIGNLNDDQIKQLFTRE